MAALYVVSAEAAAGKTAICAGLGKSLQDAGGKVGFLKPGAGDDGDAAFMKQVLALPEDAASLSPPRDAGRAKEAYDRVSPGRDVVLLEGDVSEASYGIARALNARVLVVRDYSRQANEPASYQGFGENLLGVIWNKVPASQLKRARDGAGKDVLGILPEARALSALTVGELADSIQGKILNSAEKSAELVENFMLGAMVVGSGLDYFGRKAAKAAIVRNDRPDMQLAALETDTRCLVISGGGAAPLMYSVRYKAERKGIPIILSGSDTTSIVAGIEAALSRVRFNQAPKLARLAEMLRQQLDLQAIYGGLGLAA